MIIYKRTIDKRLLSLRLSFFILGAICYLSFRFNYDNLGYFISVVIITLSIIGVKDFIVYSDSFQISKYYFFGLIKRTWKFRKNENIKISSFGSGFGEDGDISDIDDTGSGLGCLLSFVSIFVPPKIAKKEFKVEKLNVTNDVINHVNIILDRPEFNYLKSFKLPT